MNVEEMAKLFSDHSDEHFLSGEIEGPRDLAELIKINEMVPAKGDIISAAEHDKFWLETDPEKMAAVITEDDIIFFLNCGVMLDEDYEGFFFFT